MFKKFLVVAAATLIGAIAQASLEDYEGSYTGKFEGVRGSLIVKVYNSKLSVLFVGENGSTDILGGSCGSTIGEQIDIDMDGTEVDHVTFKFYPGGCGSHYQGRELQVDFGHKDGNVESARASLFVRSEFNSGSPQCWPNPYPGTGAGCIPQTQSVDVYASGKFKK